MHPVVGVLVRVARIETQHGRVLPPLARVAVTDDNNRTVRDEAENLHRLKVFDNLALLKMWTEATPPAIFPNRKIGRLLDGYEASFLALDGNPVEEFSNVRKIGIRFKPGHLIEVSANVDKPENNGKPANQPRLAGFADFGNHIHETR